MNAVRMAVVGRPPYGTWDGLAAAPQLRLIEAFTAEADVIRTGDGLAQSAAEANVAVGQRRQEHFESYLIGLVFTLLALSVQSASFGSSVVADICEILAWLLLLTAGFAGLLRLELTPEVFRLASYRVEREERLQATELHMMKGMTDVAIVPTGKVISSAEYADKDRAAIAQIAERLALIEGKLLRRYRLLKWAFAAALGLLVVARAWIPVVGIVNALRQ